MNFPSTPLPPTPFECYSVGGRRGGGDHLLQDQFQPSAPYTIQSTENTDLRRGGLRGRRGGGRKGKRRRGKGSIKQEMKKEGRVSKSKLAE